MDRELNFEMPESHFTTTGKCIFLKSPAPLFLRLFSIASVQLQKERMPAIPIVISLNKQATREDLFKKYLFYDTHQLYHFITDSKMYFSCFNISAIRMHFILHDVW